ncbi:MAG: 5-formyltetrahydrofolate cyclo-ligase [Burkholderiaceae bacterium]
MEFQLSSAAPMAADRAALRRVCLERRRAFVGGPQLEAANRSLRNHLEALVAPLEPACLGLYWAIQGEFNAALHLRADTPGTPWPLALPFAHRAGRKMDYRAWDGRTPNGVDECGIATSSGAPVEPDVVLVPCLGYTRDNHRLGYGAGYFDRWLAAHPHVTAVGVAWSVSALADHSGYVAQPHDRPLTLIVTENGVVT